MDGFVQSFMGCWTDLASISMNYSVLAIGYFCPSVLLLWHARHRRNALQAYRLDASVASFPQDFVHVL